MKTKLRKLLALLMTLAMFISSVPTTALAAVVPYPGGTETGSGISLRSIVKPPVATTTYVFMNGTEEFARQILKDGQTLNNPGTPDAGSANKEFTGWRDGDNNAPTFGAVTVTETKTITYHAQFADVYFVFFTNEKGEVMVTKKGANGDTISTEGVTYPVGNEQSIVGWKDASGNLVSSVTLNGSDVTLTARVENGHWITYDSQGGTYVAPAFVKGNGTTTAPAAPTRPGYTFRHWSATVGGAAFTFGNALTTALTLYAVWTPNTRTQYTVIHWQENADDDEYSYAESETKYGTTGAQTSAAAKSYTGFTAQTIARQTIAGDGSTIVNVYYKRNVYNVQFYERKSNRWQEIPNLKITAKYQAFIGDKWPTYNGSSTWSTTSNYSWSSGLQGPYQVNIETMPLNGAKFYGPKTGSSSESAHYYVEVLPGETGETVSGRTYKLHHTDTSPGTGYTVTVEDQYPITGFTFNSSPSTKIEEDYDNAKFYYTRNSYNIVYVSGGQTVNTASKKFEESIADAGSYTPTVKPAGMEDYDFGGWHADPAGEQAYTFTGKTMPAQNVTVYAKWNKPVYNGTIYLTIEGTGSSIILSVPKGNTIETALNEKQAEIMAQVGEGYTWRGWRTGKDGTGEPFNPQTQITTDVTLYPYYTKDGTFTVKYVSGKNDVTAPVDGKSYAEDSFADLMSPDKLVAADGEYFLGWSDGAATYQPRDKYQIKSNHADERNVITLTAQWGARPAGTTLTYKANGGAGADVVENLANNATVTTKPADTFSRVGYTFKGWDTNPKGEGSIAPNTQVQVDNNGENVLYAIWTANTDTKYTVEFYYQNVGGTYTLNHSDERTATTDKEVSVTDADKAAKENNKYVFEADNKNNVLSGNVAGNGSLVLKLYFKLNTASYTIHHYLNGTTVKVADDQTGAKTIGETLTANKSDALYAAYAAAVVASYAPSQTITIAADESKNVITVYYTMPLTIKAKDASKTYDGQPLTQPDFTVEGLVNGDTKENFTLSMTAASTITNAGSTPNEIDTDTVKYNGGAIPSYYNVSYKPGTLTITAVESEVVVTITGHKATVTYDGAEHTVTGYDVSISNELYKEADFTFTGSAEVKATDASDTAYAMGLKDTDFANKNGNFSNVTFVVTDGSLTINKRTVTLKSETASKEYDGTPLTKPDVTVTGDGFVAGEVTGITATGSVTFVHEGEVTNAITFTEGANFKETNYTISKDEGKLSITKREGEGKTITVTANSDEKVYDGAPLTNNGFTHEGALVEGDVLTAVVEGSQTDVGSSDNVVTSYRVMRGETDVTTSYTFSDSVKGALTVTLRGVTFTGESKSLPYTGGMQSITGITQSGLVEGHRYEGLTYKAEGQNVGSYDGAFSGDVVIKDAQGNDVTRNYKVTKTPGKLTITNASFTLTFTGESAEKVYNGSEQSITGITVDGLKTGHRYEGLTYAAKGTDKGEYVGAFTGTVKILDENNVDVTENYAITQTPGKLTITAVETEVIVKIRGTKDTVEYDGQKHEVNGYEVVSISNTLYTANDFGLKDGAAAHAEGTDAGDYFMNLTKDSFVNRNGNFSAVTFVVEDGKLTITKRGLDKEKLVKITAADNSVYYDGQPHGAKLNAAGQIEVGTSYTTEYLALGHKVQTVAIDGSETMVGVYEGRLVPNAAIIVDENDNDVTTNYVITYVPGTLEIRKNETEIKVTANSHTWEYDGQPHSDGGYTVEYDGQTYKVEAGKTATLPTGDVVKAKITKTVTNVADSAANNNQIDELTIVNAAGEDTKGQYKTVTLIPGTLTITKRGAGEDKVKITAADNTVEYDGRPHGAKLNAAGQIEVGTSYTVTNLAEGHSVKTLAIEGSETDAGVYADKLVPGNAVIVDGNGVEVTANYDITYVPGALTITRRGAGDDKVVLTAANNTVVYDGQPHGAKLNAAGEIEVGTSYTITNLADGHKVQSVVISGSETAVGEYENRLVPSGAKIVDAEGNDVTRNYVVGYKNGKLTITSPDTVIVTIRGNKDAVEYDGQKHEVNGYEVVSISNTLYTANDFGLKDGAAAHAEGTDAGDYFMNLTKDSFVNRNGNFSAVTFVVEDGKLTITKRGLDKEKLVKITAADNSVYYDGQPHGAKLNAAGQIEVGTSYTTEYLALGHKVQTVAIDGSETMVGVYEGRLVPNAAIIVDENDNDVTTNYVITYVPGTLEIRKNETEIKVTANSHTWEYDGQPHTDGGYTVNYDGVDYPVAAGEFATLPTGDKVTATVEGSVTNVADSADDNNVVTNVIITNKAGTVVNDQYKTITRVNGGLKITRRATARTRTRRSGSSLSRTPWDTTARRTARS